VLARLLNGSNFNFLILSSPNDASRVDRVILSPRVDGGLMPLPPAQEAAQAPDEDVPPVAAPPNDVAATPVPPEGVAPQEPQNPQEQPQPVVENDPN
jgi:hypothetical protein